ncbi:hypothetical protein TTHERM_00723300 (macronuclear) [Tetrahymena thermophila SB210]|uniref:Leucine Rich Repeat family protein n=1 Tax=Tetrahymena thermophila (strain SB210) TaxID=312017 RepID=I7M638_TETTS|nr:hypothetical protein TTHERM_00723300 [Tetrahymena thermophila SB210]EAR84145.2 hypothetical protein TTHERM_00723300 [Tetrahymena thermophila SB210]|eukprot:XP_001031808.2 hypothetical protein TTHERM_00723300 [Tetrahymena thermophila SB210]
MNLSEIKNQFKDVKSPRFRESNAFSQQVKGTKKKSIPNSLPRSPELFGSTNNSFYQNGLPLSPKIQLSQNEKVINILDQSGILLSKPAWMLSGTVTNKRTKNYKNNINLNIVSKFNLDDKKKIPKLTPVLITHQTQTEPDEKAKNESVHKYSEGKELPDYKQYGGPFNIAHIPEEGVQVELDQSEIEIIDKIANFETQDDDPLKVKMSCFTEIKQNLVKNEADYYDQFKNLNHIIEAEKFFQGNKVSSYSEMLQKIQNNKLFPKTLGLVKSNIQSQYQSNASSRRNSEILNKYDQNQKLQTQGAIESSRSIALSINTPKNKNNLSRMTSISFSQKPSSKNIQQPLERTNSQYFNLISSAINKIQAQQIGSLGNLKRSESYMNFQSRQDSPINSPMNIDKIIKTSKFRKGSFSIAKNNFTAEIQNMNLGSNKFIENEKQQEEIDASLDKKQETQSKKKIPFFMKLKSQNKNKQGNFSQDFSKEFYQKQQILTEASERFIPINRQNTQQSISSRSEIIMNNYKKNNSNSRYPMNSEYMEEEQLNLNYFSINDKQVDVVSTVVSEGKKYKVIKLSKNRITNEGLSNFLQNLPSNIKKIDISYNSFSHVGIIPLINRISKSEFTQLQEINIEGNNLGDKSISKLLTSLYDYTKLLKLNISKNSLTIDSIPYLVNLITQSSCIQELYLKWNKFKSESGQKIAEALMENDTIKVLDLSYNSLGISNNQKCQFSKTFAKLIEKDSDCSIIHIDISYNQINFQESSIISEALKKNFTILGFHFNGNCGFIDKSGFLIPTKDVSNLLSPLESKIQGVRRLEQSSLMIEATQDNCWICQGWEEKKFIWRPMISGQVQVEPIFVHISTEQYTPKKLEKEINGNLVYYVYRGMFPPNTKINYFFTSNGHCLFAKEQTNEEINLTNIQISYSDETTLIPQIQIVNTFTTNKNNQIIDESNYQIKIKSKPRVQIFKYPKPELKELQIIWNLSQSLFYEYQNENDEQLIEQCFEFDIRYSQIEHYIMNDFLSFKRTIRKYYKQIKDVFKYYSSYKPFLGEKWTIPIEVFIQLLSSGPIEIIDEKYLKKCSIAVIFDQTNQNEKKNNNIPPKQLARHNFLLAILRVAEIKYLQSGLAQDHKTAFEMLFEKGFQQVCNQVQCEHLWRINNLWNQEVDLVLQYYKPLINYLFNKDLRQLTVAFYLVTTQVDCINKYKHLYLNLLEFYEAVARLANLLIIYPVGFDFLDESTLCYFKDMDICCKLESMLVKIFQKRKNETKTLSEITVSQTSLFDQKIRQFIQQKQIFKPITQNNQEQAQTITTNIQLQVSSLKRQSIVLPTPIDYAQSTFQHSNPQIFNTDDKCSETFDSVKSNFVNGQLVRRSGSMTQNFKSIYFQPSPQQEKYSIDMQDSIRMSQNIKQII